MRLLHCRVQNVRLHAELALRFDPGLTLIGGGNESGKSTLVEALHRTLFLKASAAGAPVEALRSHLHAGHPTVEIGFETAADRWTLIKRFSGASGSATLRSEAGELLHGPAAEERLAALLAVGETLGGKQMARLPGRWAHLWVTQGRGGDNPLALDGDTYELNTLIERLEASGGAALQSGHDQRVAARLDEILAETFTAKKGEVRRQSALWAAQQAAHSAGNELEQARDRLLCFESASDELAQLEAALDQLQTVTLPERESQRRALQRAGQRTERLRHDLALRSRELEPLRLQHQALLERSSKLLDLSSAIRQRQQELQQVQASVLEGRRQQELIEAEQQRVQASREALAAQRQALEQRGQRVSRLLNRARLESERLQILSTLQQRQRQAEARRALERQLAELPPVGEAELRRLRGLERAAGEARVRIDSLAAGVELLQSDLRVLVNGQPLQPGQDCQLTQVAELRVGEGVRVRISPGGGQALAEGQRVLLERSAAFAAALAALGLNDLDSAEQLALQRAALLQQLAGQAAGSSAANANLESKLESTLEERRLEAIALDGAALEQELESLASVQREEEGRDPLPCDQEGLDRLHRQLQQTYQLSIAPFRQAEQELGQLRQRLEISRNGLESALRRQAQLDTEIQLQQQRQLELLADHGNAEALAAALAASAAERASAESGLTSLQAELTALEGDNGPSAIEQLDREIGRLQEECLALTARRGAAVERCEAMASGDPYAVLEQAQALLESAEAELASIRRHCDARLLLRQLFTQAQADLSSRYSEPLAAAVDAYLAPLLADAARCRLRFDPATGFSGLQLRRGDAHYDFAALSGGMREQLSAALRLAMADVLKQAHGGCLPLVFDDAFTNSDPERVTGLQAMLSTAVARGLQVILLTCSPADYASLNGHQIRLDAPGQARHPLNP